jgi:hypothetical protein
VRNERSLSFDPGGRWAELAVNHDAYSTNEERRREEWACLLSSFIMIHWIDLAGVS